MSLLCESGNDRALHRLGVEIAAELEISAVNGSCSESEISISVEPVLADSAATSALGGLLGKGITSPAGSACTGCTARAADPLTPWLSDRGADCITGPDPKGERGGGGGPLDDIAEEEREPEDELRGGNAGVLGVADPPPLTGPPWRLH